ncbi:UNVERIFIED_CONTAM: Retrovirus-related Pol polyprotein from transposon RE2 [Sesamum radiatum]|uniref:Retrovirus-related Pol polyprotein from transposon RE2 n=1 Tax=Sesamum radiatum TaxID=300843 RepID=A0AAW2TVU4_SESRA
MAPSKTVARRHIRYGNGKPASYKYLRVWGSPAYVKRLVGDKLDSRSSLCRSTRVSQQPERYGFLGLTDQLDNDPKTYGEAMSNIDSEKWIEAMKSEMDSMSLNKVWTLVDPPRGVKPVGCKWVYKRKLGADGEVTTYKARLVAKGYTQRPRVDFEETYSPVAMAKSIRIMLAITAWYDYEIWKMDVKTAFLNGFVEEEIYMDQPEGFTSVERRAKSLPSPKMLGDTKAWLSTQFSMKDLGEASYILGIKIIRDRSKRMLGMTQTSYVEKVLKEIQDGKLQTRIPSCEAWG